MKRIIVILTAFPIAFKTWWEAEQEHIALKRNLEFLECMNRNATAKKSYRTA